MSVIAKSQPGNPTQPVTAQLSACEEPDKSITISRAELMQSAEYSLRKSQSVKRALESALQLVAEIITDDQQLINRLKTKT